MRHWWTLGGLTLAISLALAVAGPAAAGLHNALPADADENPADVFNDNDALFAYTTSDFTGGYVCILHAEAPADRTCDGPAWGDKNRVVGIGSQFTLIEFGDLLPGHWRLQTVDSEGKNGEAGGEFTVVPCPGCDNSISAAAAAQAKASAQGLGSAAGAGVPRLRGQGARRVDFGGRPQHPEGFPPRSPSQLQQRARLRRVGRPRHRRRARAQLRDPDLE